MSSESILQARPPATDYMTYLTIIEYNLTKETLPTLVTVLQDEELTRNIGWDLINTLLPLLPESQAALDVVVKLGNPREVVLKVTEALRLLEFEGEEVSEDEDGRDESTTMQKQQDQEVLAIMQMKALLSMLPGLHARLNTKTPSRFLSTTLQAVLAAFSNLGAACEVMYEDVNTFTKALQTALISEESSSEEIAMQMRLFQSFLTHIFELYVLMISDGFGEAAFAWSSRAFEQLVPTKVVPGKLSAMARFMEGGAHFRRAQAEKATLQLAEELKLDVDVLLDAILHESEAITNNHDDEEDPPHSANDIPLSAQGSLFLLASLFVQRLLAGEQIQTDKLPVFEIQSTLLSKFIGAEALGGLGSAGSEPPSTIDAILALSLLAVVDNCVGTTKTDEDFTSYLQVTSLLSANTPSPESRYVAHYITSKLLHSHPSDHTRLTFIRDTLEHCPYENLKASAVEWFKMETMSIISQGPSSSEATSSIFATPSALEAIAEWMFPNQRHTAYKESEAEMWMIFNANLSFNLAALNFYLFLFISSGLRVRLGMIKFHEQHNMNKSYLTPFRDMIKQISTSISSGPMSRNLDEQDIATARLDVALMENVLDRVEEKLAEVGLT